MTHDVDAIACFEGAQWTALDGHLVAEHPRMTPLHAAFVTAAKIQIGKTHQCFSEWIARVQVTG
jgi:hypothetical protein